MITNIGNQIITKFLLGQAPEYSSYLAVGVGAKPLSLTENDNTSPTKKSMDFEAFRVPILSKGLVSDNITLSLSNFRYDTNLNNILVTTTTTHNLKIDDEVTIQFSNTSIDNIYGGTFKVIATNGTNEFYYEDPSLTTGAFFWQTSSGSNGTATVSYSRERIIFKAELPTDQKYEMSEIALYPAENNNLASSYDSKIMAGFLENEGWGYAESSGTSVTVSQIDSTSANIGNTNGFITSSTFVNSDNEQVSALFVNSDNILFEYKTGEVYSRKARLEAPRLYNKSLIVKGNMSNFTTDDMNTSGISYITTEQLTFNFKDNSPNDYIKLAFSLIDDSPTSPATPYKIRLRWEFLNIASSGTSLKATIKEVISSGSEYYTQINSGNRYVVVAKQLKDFIKDVDFSWSNVNGIRIYIQTIDAAETWDQSYISFDGMRIDNENTYNPLYGMIAYSRLRNQYSENLTITKGENTTGYIEYRLGLGIV
jgi:hypothetical protein